MFDRKKAENKIFVAKTDYNSFRQNKAGNDQINKEQHVEIDRSGKREQECNTFYQHLWKIRSEGM